MIFFKRFLLLSFSLVFIGSCAGTEQIPPKPNYGTRADYPQLNGTKLMVINGEAEYELFKFDAKSRRIMIKKWREFYKKKRCDYVGRIRLEFVVTKAGKIDAPLITPDLSSQCEEAILLALRYLKVETPGKVSGKPVNVLSSVPFAAK